ncbi:MAG: hypothetical protein WD534_18165 [Phycisphaeraceae bacterium]
MISVKKKVAFRGTDARRRRDKKDAQVGAAAELGRVPRVARLMALAIHFDELIRSGQVADQSELARLAHVTQPRMTQIMNLLHLAPDIQEALLVLVPTIHGHDPVTERHIRPICRESSWVTQRSLWQCLRQVRTNARCS